MPELDAIRADLAELEARAQDPALAEELSFAQRAELSDALELAVIDRIERLLYINPRPEALFELRRRALALRRRLEATDERLFERLRSAIRAGALSGTPLRALISASVGHDAASGEPGGARGYDSLDLFVNGLLLAGPAPRATKTLEPEMVAYQKAPARNVFELVERAGLTADDVFYDIGSGLGHAPILVNLLSGARARGVEYEPAYCAYARACAAALNLPGVTFVEGDARAAGYGDGTAFFLYTPFEGAMLQAVLARLREATEGRAAQLFTYGPCTPAVARAGWLERLDELGDRYDGLGHFRGRGAA